MNGASLDPLWAPGQPAPGIKAYVFFEVHATFFVAKELL
ncbi:hypothetical protein SBV1_1710021 [Verrucomicrobia bacterium]|nr:hypothetical protein SBV1_1710021 [Verrucomicrobiota bacterium]